MTAARKVELLSINTIVIPEGRRHLQEDKVCELAAGMKKLGLLQAVTVRMLEGKPRLIDGLHRLNAARALRWLDIECEIIEADDRRARMVEIVANLHRAELMVLDRSEQITELVSLAKEEEELSAQPAQKTGRGRPEGGQSAAAREMGVDRDAVQRAQKIAALPPQAKKIARDLGLADNQSALLKAAKSEDKVSALQQYVKRRRHTPEELAQTRAAQPPRDQAQQRTRNAPDALDRVVTLLIETLGDRI